MVVSFDDCLTSLHLPAGLHWWGGWCAKVVVADVHEEQGCLKRNGSYQPTTYVTVLSNNICRFTPFKLTK